MTTKVSHASIIWAIVLKDLRAFSRDKMWAVLTPLFLVVVIGLFWVLPNTVDETITVGVYPQEMADALVELEASEEEASAQGLEVVSFDAEEDLAAVVSGEVEDEEYDGLGIGLAFPDDFVERTLAGDKTTVTVYLDNAIPEEISGAMSSAIREIAYGLQAAARGETADEAMPVVFPDEQQIILGEDRAGEQVPIREKMRPMLAYMILLMESMALSGLVASEIQDKTVTALLVTPARTMDVIIAKGVAGGILAAAQAVIFVLATRTLGSQWWIMLLLLFLGALMMAGAGLISGAAGKDFINTLFYSMLFIIPLMIPTFSVLFPGSAAPWIKVIPSYGLIQAMVGVTGYGQGWSEVAGHVGVTALWVVGFLGVSVVLLKRKVETL